ncbi:MAG TPA: adenosylcobinamide-phosphate synthase CbiB [Pseudomonadales bacterium]
MAVLSIFLAVLLDRLFAEPRCYHPLAGFGRLATLLEQQLNCVSDPPWRQWAKGLLALLLLLLPPALLAGWLQAQLASSPWLLCLLSALLLYLTIGWQSLKQHAQAVFLPLQQGDLAAARAALAMIVSRDTASLDEQGIAVAATESVLENGADALFSALFWFLLAGLPEVVVYRLCNTLDAMWGYRNARFAWFGKSSARLDDVLNWLPARLTALLYTLAGNSAQARHCWRQQAARWKSPNAGVVMAAGAGALGVSLGGAACYHGQWQQRPLLGLALQAGSAANRHSIVAACRLLDRSLGIFLLLSVLLSLPWVLS